MKFWKKEHEKVFSSGGKCYGNAWYFVLKNFGEEVPHWIGASVEKFNNKARKGGVRKVVCVALTVMNIVSILLFMVLHLLPHPPHASRNNLYPEVSSLYQR